MPVAKSRTKQVNLVQEVAYLLEIPEERIYLTGDPSLLDPAEFGGHSRLLSPKAQKQDAENRYRVGHGHRLQLRVWTGGMGEGERERLASLKDAVKELAGKTGTKIAMSDRHPEEQAAYELRRRRSRGKAWKLRKQETAQ